MKMFRSNVGSMADAVGLLGRVSDSTKSASQVESSIYIKPTKAGLVMRSTDGTAFAEATAVIIETGALEAKEIAVSIKVLSEILQLHHADETAEIEFVNSKDKRRPEDRGGTVIDAAMHMTIGKNEYKLTGFWSGDILPGPRPVDNEIARLEIDALDFTNLLRLGRAAVSNSKDAPATYTSLHFKILADRLVVSASDSYRAAIADRDISVSKGEGVTFSLDGRNAKKLQTAFDEIDDLEIVCWAMRPASGIVDRVFIRAAGMLIDLPVAMTTQPEIAKLINDQSFAEHVTIKVDDLKTAVKLARIISGSNRRIRFIFDEGYRFTTWDAELGDMVYMVPTAFGTGAEPISIDMDLRFLDDFATASRAAEIVIEYTNRTSPVLLHGTDNTIDRLMFAPIIYDN